MRKAVIRLRRFASDPRYAPFFTAQLWRIGSGSVLLAFVTLHFLNHALGVFGTDAMEAVQAWRRGFWRTNFGTVLLYGAAAVHVALALKKIVGRTTWRMPWKEAVQIAFGLAIPVMVHAHIAATRGVNTAFGLDDTYTHELRLLWPAYQWSHSLMLVVVWTHGMIGLQSALSARPWFRAWRDRFFAFALLVPALALAGWISAGRAVEARTFEGHPLTLAQYLFIRGWEAWTDQAILIVFAAMALVIALAAMLRWQGPRIRVRYLGRRVVKAVPGATLLEISRANDVPHASVCGGRARCSTCRVRVVEGLERLDGIADRERKVLMRIGAPAGVRLACCIVPRYDLAVELLVAPEEALQSVAGGADPARWGVERQITVLFGDLRGFTTLSEKHLAFDVVFLLNRYLALMSEAVTKNGGQVDKFLGDGVLALFGVAGDASRGSRSALAAAHDMFKGLDVLNAEFAAFLSEPLKMGVGVHTGPVILGRVGAAGSSSGLTALGDTVNTASRLQDATKTLGATLVASEETLRAAGIALGPETRHEITVRGRMQAMEVHAVDGTKPLEARQAVAA